MRVHAGGASRSLMECIHEDMWLFRMLKDGDPDGMSPILFLWIHSKINRSSPMSTSHRQVEVNFSSPNLP